MVDTHGKRTGNLLTFLNLAALAKLVAAIRQQGLRVVLGGALVCALASCKRSEGPFAVARFVEALGYLLALKGGQRLSRTDTSTRRLSAGSDQRMDRIAAYLHKPIKPSQLFDALVSRAQAKGAARWSPAWW